MPSRYQYTDEFEAFWKSTFTAARRLIGDKKNEGFIEWQEALKYSTIDELVQGTEHWFVMRSRKLKAGEFTPPPQHLCRFLRAEQHLVGWVALQDENAAIDRERDKAASNVVAINSQQKTYRTAFQKQADAERQQQPLLIEAGGS